MYTTVDQNLTHIDNPEDLPFLRQPLFDVNMRLFRSSPTYKSFIRIACECIKQYCTNEMEGYKKPHGMSGANAAIPYNIIAYLTKRNTPDEQCNIMINPKIIHRSKETVKSKSNCGSIRLPEPIEIERNKEITIEWFDLEGVEHKGNFTREVGGMTLQHEIDHNLGILITDRQTKK